MNSKEYRHDEEDNGMSLNSNYSDHTSMLRNNSLDIKLNCFSKQFHSKILIENC